MTELVENFVGGLKESIERAQVAFASNDMAVLQRVTQLKGAAGGYGYVITDAAAVPNARGTKRAGRRGQVG